jgi:hypothetical protein
VEELLFAAKTITSTRPINANAAYKYFLSSVLDFEESELKCLEEFFGSELKPSELGLQLPKLSLTICSKLECLIGSDLDLAPRILYPKENTQIKEVYFGNFLGCW